MQPSGSPSKAGKVACPLCGGERLRPLDVLPVGDVSAEYRRQFQVDVRKEFHPGVASLDLNECCHCGLQFFHPLISGSADFYSSLSDSQGYYSNSRWEFSRAFRWIGERAEVVDVGCGDGHFLSIIPHPSKFGLEHNPAAVARARARGLDVRSAALADLPDHSADIVTFFQVLEHVVDPLGTLRDAVRVLRDGGFLLIAVPNNDGYIGQAIQNPLNVPPHHPLRWNRRALSFLPNLLPLEVKELVDEPLAADQVFLYRRTRMTNALAACLGIRFPLMKLNLATIFVRKATNALTLLSLKLHPKAPPGPIAGHTSLAVYQKTV